MDTCIITTSCNGWLVFGQAILNLLFPFGLGLIIGWLTSPKVNTK